METIEKVVKWLKGDGYEPEQVKHPHPDTTFFAKVKISERSSFHVGFSATKPDHVLISEMIELKEDDQKLYASLPAVEQNRFFFDIELALIQKNVMYDLEDGIRSLRSIEVFKPIYFDGLTKDKFFDTIYAVHYATRIAKIKLGQLRDRLLPDQAGLGDNDGENNLK